MSLKKFFESLLQKGFSENLYKVDSAEAEHLPKEGEVDVQKEKENLIRSSVIQKEKEEDTNKAEEKTNRDEKHV